MGIENNPALGGNPFPEEDMQQVRGEFGSHGVRRLLNLIKRINEAKRKGYPHGLPMAHSYDGHEMHRLGWVAQYGPSGLIGMALRMGLLTTRAVEGYEYLDTELIAERTNVKQREMDTTIYCTKTAFSHPVGIRVAPIFREPGGMATYGIWLMLLEALVATEGHRVRFDAEWQTDLCQDMEIDPTGFTASITTLLGEGMLMLADGYLSCPMLVEVTEGEFEVIMAQQ